MVRKSVALTAAMPLLVAGFLLITAGPAAANPSSEGPQSMEGSIQIHPGDYIAAGYEFSMPGSHPADDVGFDNAVVTLPVSCSSGGALAGTITIDLSGGPYQVPANDTSTWPANNESNPLTFEGSTTAPDFCSGAPMFSAANSPNSGGGATFTTDLQATLTNGVNVAFHYRDPNAKGDGNINSADPGANPYGTGNNGPCGASWSGTTSFTPTVTSDPLPMGALGSLGLAAVAGVALLVLQRRRLGRPRQGRGAATVQRARQETPTRV